MAEETSWHEIVQFDWVLDGAGGPDESTAAMLGNLDKIENKLAELVTVSAQSFSQFAMNVNPALEATAALATNLTNISVALNTIREGGTIDPFAKGGGTPPAPPPPGSGAIITAAPGAPPGAYTYQPPTPPEPPSRVYPTTGYSRVGEYTLQPSGNVQGAGGIYESKASLPPEIAELARMFSRSPERPPDNPLLETSLTGRFAGYIGGGGGGQYPEYNYKAPPISGTDPSVMTAAAINRELEKLSQQSSKLTDAMIEAGRGNESPSDLQGRTDTMSQAARDIDSRLADLRFEVEQRAGPGMTSLPRGRGFGPRHTQEELDYANEGKVEGLLTGSPAGLPELVAQSRLTTSQVTQALTSLELQGRAQQLPGQSYIRSGGQAEAEIVDDLKSVSAALGGADQSARLVSESLSQTRASAEGASAGVLDLSNTLQEATAQALMADLGLKGSGLIAAGPSRPLPGMLTPEQNDQLNMQTSYADLPPWLQQLPEIQAMFGIIAGTAPAIAQIADSLTQAANAQSTALVPTTSLYRGIGGGVSPQAGQSNEWWTPYSQYAMRFGSQKAADYFSPTASGDVDLNRLQLQASVLRQPYDTYLAGGRSTNQNYVGNYPPNLEASFPGGAPFQGELMSAGELAKTLASYRQTLQEALNQPTAGIQGSFGASPYTTNLATGAPAAAQSVIQLGAPDLNAAGASLASVQSAAQAATPVLLNVAAALGAISQSSLGGLGGGPPGFTPALAIGPTYETPTLTNYGIGGAPVSGMLSDQWQGGLANFNNAYSDFSSQANSLSQISDLLNQYAIAQYGGRARDGLLGTEVGAPVETGWTQTIYGQGDTLGGLLNGPQPEIIPGPPSAWSQGWPWNTPSAAPEPVIVEHGGGFNPYSYNASAGGFTYSAGGGGGGAFGGGGVGGGAFQYTPPPPGMQGVVLPGAGNAWGQGWPWNMGMAAGGGFGGGGGPNNINPAPGMNPNVFNTFTDSMNNATGAAGLFERAIQRFAVYGLIFESFRVATQILKDFGQEMITLSDTQARLSFINGQPIQQTQAQFAQAAQYGITPAQAAPGLLAAAQLGASPQQQEQASQLAAVFGTNQYKDALTQLNRTQELSNAVGLKSVDTMDFIAESVKTMPGTMDDYFGALQKGIELHAQFGVSAESMGLAIEQASKNTGQSVDQIGVLFQSMLSKVQTPATQKALESYGITTGTPQQMISQVNAQIQQMSAAGNEAGIQQLMEAVQGGGIGGYSRIENLPAAMAAFNTALNDSNPALSSWDLAFSKLTDSAQLKINQLTASWQNFLLALGSGVPGSVATDFLSRISRELNNSSSIIENAGRAGQSVGTDPGGALMRMAEYEKKNPITPKEVLLSALSPDKIFEQINGLMLAAANGGTGGANFGQRSTVQPDLPGSGLRVPRSVLNPYPAPMSDFGGMQTLPSSVSMPDYLKMVQDQEKQLRLAGVPTTDKNYEVISKSGDLLGQILADSNAIKLTNEKIAANTATFGGALPSGVTPSNAAAFQAKVTQEDTLLKNAGIQLSDPKTVAFQDRATNALVIITGHTEGIQWATQQTAASLASFGGALPSGVTAANAADFQAKVTKEDTLLRNAGIQLSDPKTVAYQDKSGDALIKIVGTTEGIQWATQQMAATFPTFSGILPKGEDAAKIQARVNELNSQVLAPISAGGAGLNPDPVTKIYYDETTRTWKVIQGQNAAIQIATEEAAKALQQQITGTFNVPSGGSAVVDFYALQQGFQPSYLNGASGGAAGATALNGSATNLNTSANALTSSAQALRDSAAAMRQDVGGTGSMAIWQQMLAELRTRQGFRTPTTSDYPGPGYNPPPHSPVGFQTPPTSNYPGASGNPNASSTSQGFRTPQTSDYPGAASLESSLARTIQSLVGGTLGGAMSAESGLLKLPALLEGAIANIAPAIESGLKGWVAGLIHGTIGQIPNPYARMHESSPVAQATSNSGRQASGSPSAQSFVVNNAIHVSLDSRQIAYYMNRNTYRQFESVRNSVGSPNTAATI